MYDIILDKIVLSKLKTSSSTDTVIYEEYSFPSKYYQIQFQEKSKIIASGSYQTPNKIQEIDLNSGKTVADYGVIDDAPKDIPFYAWKRANEAFMVLSPNKNKIALAHLGSDQVEIFDLKSRKSITVKGPENFSPEFIPFKSDDGRDLIGPNEKSRNAFGGLMSTDKYIYAPYSGNDIRSPYIIYGKTIYVYNWDGKPVKKINLDRYVSSFTVGDDNTTLYAFDVASQYIVSAKM